MSTDIYEKIQPIERKKRKKRIILPEKRRRKFSRYRRVFDDYFTKHPELRHDERLHRMMRKTDEECLEIYIDLTLSSIRQWIAGNGFKKKNLYETIKRKVKISKSSFYNILNGQKTCSLETRLGVIEILLKNDKLKPEKKGYLDAYKDAVKPLERIWKNLTIESDLYANACLHGKRVGKREKETYLEKHRKALEKRREKNVNKWKLVKRLQKKLLEEELLEKDLFEKELLKREKFREKIAV